MQATDSVSQPAAVKVPHSRLNIVRSDLLRSLMMADSAKTPAETALADATFLRAVAQSHVLSYRCAFYVVRRDENGGRLTLEVSFVFDPMIWEGR